MNLYRNIDDSLKETEYLTEMSFDTSTVIKKITDELENINEHLIKCLVIQNTTNNLNHWEKEIYNFLHNTYKLKSTKKYPDEDLLRENTIIGFGDCLLEQLDILIESICYDENAPVSKYNKQAVYNGIINYYKWIIPILSKNGAVNNVEVYNEIDTLIEQYNKENK